MPRSFPTLPQRARVACGLHGLRAMGALQALLKLGAHRAALLDGGHSPGRQAHREYPNRLFPSGMTRDLKASLESAERGQRVLTSQRYEVRQAVADGDQVALEIDWSGTLAVPLGTLPEGGLLRAALGAFITFHEGFIISQRNYDCYEPF